MSSPTFKQRLAAGEVTLGGWVSLASEAVAEIMCAAGLEWVAVDLEHSTTALADAERLIRVIDGRGRAPLVRLTANDPQQIKRVMDAGAHGVIVPNVRGREDVLRTVRAMHYPPRGERGVGLARAQGYGASFGSYRAWLETSAVLVAQIEHVDALAELDAILGVPELDAVLIGPYDLSASMGAPGVFDAPGFVDAMATIRRAAAARGKPAGIHVVEPDPAALRARLDEGYRLVAYSVDFRMIDVACRAGVDVLRR